VNHRLGKNLIGAFYQPNFVLSDIATLKTLPQRELISGLAEVIKYGIIWDEKLFTDIEHGLQSIPNLQFEQFILLADIVARCCQIKAEVVSKDERESGLRTILNFGHTIGHALEAVSHYKLKHGEAVILGMMVVNKIAVERGDIPREVFERIENLLKRVPIKPNITKLQDYKILEAMNVDKKVLQRKPRFVLPKRIGEVFVTDGVRKEQIRRGIKYMKSIILSRKN